LEELETVGFNPHANPAAGLVIDSANGQPVIHIHRLDHLTNLPGNMLYPSPPDNG
jgi:hypothetical protein